MSSEHIVQFFDTDESRARNVATFLAQGYAAGEPLIIVARPANVTAIYQHLDILGVPTDAALDSGALIAKDADDTLRRLSRSGRPDPVLFNDTVGKAVRALSGRGRVRAYGEMVDMLALRDDLNGALRLEGFWNQLADRTPLFLMCGYSAAHFVSSATHRALVEICKAHSGVNRDTHDPLGNWLLNAAHNSAACSSSLRH